MYINLFHKQTITTIFMDNNAETLESTIKFMNSCYEKFTKHPTQVCMDYYTHLKFSFCLAKLHAYGVYICCAHAICPFWYTTSVTELNKKINDILKTSGCDKKE